MWSNNAAGSFAFNLATKLKNVQTELRNWNKTSFGHIGFSIKKQLDELQHIQKQIHTPTVIEQEHNMRIELQRLLHCEELFWAQLARQLWLVHGDRNTKYFHAVVKRRRINNCITKIQDLNGNWITNYNDLETIAVDYFKEVYTPNDSASSSEIKDTLAGIQLPCLSSAQINLLSAPFKEDEIEKPVFQMRPDKSPGPDGLPAIFYQQFWDIVKEDVINMSLSFLHRGYLLKCFNETFITLIPKHNVPITFKDFRPIGLCNVVYKIISKVLVNRLQPLMQDYLISPYQNGFLKGRSIQDNIFLASELLTYIHKARKCKTNWCAFKIDIFKAYDRLR